VPNLRNIEKEITDALFDLFGTPPPTDGSAPEAVLRYLRFLKGEPGKGGTGRSALRKPQVTITDWQVSEGRWHVTFELSARNRETGWSLEPRLRFVGLDGKGQTVAWSSLTAVSGATIEDDGKVTMPGQKRGRKLTAVLRGTSTDDLPIPAEESAIDVVVAQVTEGDTLDAEQGGENE